MDFDKRVIEQYRKEALARWGDTQAYREYANKADRRPEETAKQLMAIFAGFGECKNLSPDAKEVQDRVGSLQQFITDHYYVCTDEILSGLGQMYTDDARFQTSIDKAGGAGTAAFVRQAIAVYCAR